MWYRTKLAELTEGIRPLINWKWTKIGFKGWKQRNGDGAGSSEKEKNLGYFHQVSLLDYFLGSEPKVGVASSAGGRPFIYFFCPSREHQRQRMKLKCDETTRTEGSFSPADTETTPLLLRRLHTLVIKDRVSFLTRRQEKPATSCTVK